MKLIRRLAASAFAAVAARGIVPLATDRPAQLLVPATDASAGLALGSDTAAPDPDGRAEF